jgi:hypothetical protein
MIGVVEAQPAKGMAGGRYAPRGPLPPPVREIGVLLTEAEP